MNTIPVVHGSALFQRGETQTLATVTVGGAEDQKKNDTLLGRQDRQLIVHYGFPPYANNEVRACMQLPCQGCCQAARATTWVAGGDLVVWACCDGIKCLSTLYCLRHWPTNPAQNPDVADLGPPPRLGSVLRNALFYPTSSIRSPLACA